MKIRADIEYARQKEKKKGEKTMQKDLKGQHRHLQYSAESPNFLQPGYTTTAEIVSLYSKPTVRNCFTFVFQKKGSGSCGEKRAIGEINASLKFKPCPRHYTIILP